VNAPPLWTTCKAFRFAKLLPGSAGALFQPDGNSPDKPNYSAAVMLTVGGVSFLFITGHDAEILPH
jgi:hypothetical protein